MGKFDTMIFGSIGTLGAMSALMAFRMSMYRLGGSPGGDKPNSPLNKFSDEQLLHAEWAPVGAFLALAMYAKGTSAEYTAYLIAAFTASRIVFTASMFLSDSRRTLVGLPAMVTCYAATLGMSAMLIAA